MIHDDEQSYFVEETPLSVIIAPGYSVVSETVHQPYGSEELEHVDVY